MSIVAKMKEDQLAARKAGEGDKTANLTYILGKLSQIKSEKDEDAIAFVRSLIKTTREDAVAHNYTLSEKQEADLTFLAGYLPCELTDDEIYAFLDKARDSGDKITKAYMGKINMFAKSQGKIVNNVNASLILNAYL